MNRSRIECIACFGSFNSEKEYSLHECTPVSNSPGIKEEEPMEQDDNSQRSNIIVKIEPRDLLEISDEIDPLSFITIKEENISNGDDTVLDIKTDNSRIAVTAEEVTKSEDEELSTTAKSFVLNKSNLQCNSCNKTFQSHRTFNRHVVSAHKTFKPYSCSICDKKFLQKHYVTLHMRVHTGERPYICPLCPKRYTHKTSFTIHMRIHRGERPYECGICGKKCYDKSGLTSHIRSHTKETPYKCDVCDRRFTHSKSLLVHKRNHTGEKPYICRYCGKAFRHWHKHKIHIRLHTGERPYKCKVCGKGFPRNDEVKRHMRSHTGIKSFRCSICDAYCATQSSITGHINLHHSNLKIEEEVDTGTSINDDVSGIINYKAPETREIFKNIAQQSSYVAKILMTAQNIKEKKRIQPSTKVIEITTNETPPLRPIKPRLRNIQSTSFTTSTGSEVSKLINSEKSLNSKEFSAWQEKMLEKQGLVVKGLPADNGKNDKLISFSSTPLKQNDQLRSSRATRKQHYILLQQPGKNSSFSNLLLPVKNAERNLSNKIPIDVPLPRITAKKPTKPYLIVPESVAAQPMFLLSSGAQKLLLVSAPAPGGSSNGSLAHPTRSESPSSKIKIENVSNPPSPIESMSPLSIKMEAVN